MILDIEILLLLQNLREMLGGFLNSFFTFVTNVAVDYYVALPALMIFWAVDKRKGAQVLGTWGTSLLGGAVLKTTFCVYRPWIRDARIQPVPEAMAGATGYSFPSGHSCSSGGFYFGVAAAYRQHKALVRFCVGMVLLTMFSRLYVGVHTPQDVLVGASVALLAAVLVNKGMAWVDENPEKDWVILAWAAVIFAAALLYIRLKHYPETYVDGQLLVDPKKMTVDGFKDPGRGFGILLGWFLERRYVRFSVEGSPVQKVVRCAVGALLFVFVWTAVCDPLGKAVGIGLVHFLLQAGIMVLCMTVYPMIFTKLEKK